jgi:outer membrane protein assembly factor BamB
MFRTGLACGLCFLALGSDWPEFRGPGCRGLAQGTAPRELAADKNVAWRVDLPGRGLSSPIVVGERVFLTASSGSRGDRLHVLAYAAATGKLLWERVIWATGPTACHPKSCMAAPTPVSDGRYVVALFATDDLVCFDLAGNLQWARALYEENPGATDGRGLAASPVLVGATVIVDIETQNVSFATGIDIATGASRWRLGRPRQYNWTTPFPLSGKNPGEPLVLLQGATRLSACVAATGSEVWALERASHPIASSTIEGNRLLVPGEKGLCAFELQSSGAAPKFLWEKPKLLPDTASSIVLNGKIYSLRGAILVAGDAVTGEVVGQLRLKGTYSASLVSAGGLIYCFNEEGLAQVVRTTEKEPVLLSSGTFKETILCTPAIADGALYVRSDKHLWKMTEAKSLSVRR